MALRRGYRVAAVGSGDLVGRDHSITRLLPPASFQVVGGPAGNLTERNRELGVSTARFRPVLTNLDGPGAATHFDRTH